MLLDAGPQLGSDLVVNVIGELPPYFRAAN